MMKIILVLLLVLVGCEENINTTRPLRQDVLWINKSDHLIRVAAQGKNDLDITLSHEDRYRFSDNYAESFYMGGETPLERYGFDLVDVYFDTDVHISYERKFSDELHSTLEAPPDYPTNMSPFSESRYSISLHVDEPFYIHTWIYTFTNADYEAAREWTEKQ